MALIGWARVSTQGQSLQDQEQRLKDYGCIKVFSNKQSGASSKNADDLSEMLESLRGTNWGGEVDTLVVTKLDRLGRSLKQVIDTVEALKAKGCHLVTLDQPIDTRVKDDYMSTAMLQMMGIFAEMERNFIVERTQAGRQRTGKLGGAPRTISDEVKQKIKERFAAGETKYAIAQSYNISNTSVARIIRGVQ